MPNLKTISSTLVKTVKNNASLILTIAEGAGLIATAVLSADAAIKTNERIVEQQNNERVDIYNRYKEQNKLDEFDILKTMELTPSERYSLSTKETIGIWSKPVVVGGLTLASIIFNYRLFRLNLKHQAALVAGAGAVGNMYAQYRNKTIELYGKEADEKIINEVIKAEPVYFNIGSINRFGEVNEPMTFYDDTFGCFEQTPFNVLQAIYHLNRAIATEGMVSLAQWFNFLGIDHDVLKDPEYCETHGWIFDQLVEGGWGDLPWFDIWFTEEKLDDGMTVISFDYLIPIVDLEDESTWKDWV